MPRRGIDLTDDQWRLVKSHAAKRGQTISEFFADVLGDLGLDGHVRPAVKAQVGSTVERSHMDGDTRVIDKVELHEVSIVPDTKANRDAGAGHITSVTPGHGFGASRPAPKPGKKK